VRFRNINRVLIDVASGGIVPAGGFVELTETAGTTKLSKDANDDARRLAEAADAVLLAASIEHPHNAAYIADGVLVPAPAKPTHKEPTK
jgi:hypothetical protein